MDLNLDTKTAIVTGASQGIGRAIALELAREGARVFAVGRNHDLLETLLEDGYQLQSGSISTFDCDLLQEDAVAKIVEKAFAVLNHIDILVNNAGRSQPLEIVDSASKWKQSMTLEFERPRQLTEALLPHFINRRGGSILNVISAFELQSINASAVAKSALVAWSKQLSWQVGQHGIRINCLQPGLIDTENIRRFFSAEERKAFAYQHIAMHDFGSPDDMASMAAFLVSPRARYITGAVTTVDGGMKRSPF